MQPLCVWSVVLFLMVSRSPLQVSLKVEGNPPGSVPFGVSSLPAAGSLSIRRRGDPLVRGGSETGWREL